jgi:soluble lytic murein transglycosylase-like protein
MAPEHALDLGGRWFGQELLPYHQGNLLYAVAEHNAGRPAVLKWQAIWKAQGRAEDFEYQVETIRFLETRNFARRVWADVEILRAAGVFENGTL